MAVEHVELSIIAPKEATNLVTNPSIEIDTTGYAVVNGAIARVTTQQRRGVASLQTTPSTGVNCNTLYPISLTNGVQYSFSLDILDVVGQTFTLYVSDSLASVLATGTAWIGNGQWKRRGLAFTANTHPPFNLTLQRSSVASVAPFYTDGWQCEVGAPSTYFDGDMQGWVVGQQAYYWTGLPHQSASFRSGQTMTGGTEMKLSTLMWVGAIVGLGMAPIKNVSLPNSTGGSKYQNTIATERPFAVSGMITGANIGALEQARSSLINLVKPDVTTYKQQFLMHWQGTDHNGLESAEDLYFPASYESGLEGALSGPTKEDISISFKTYLPMIFQDGEKSVALGYQTAIANANYILQRKLGLWSALNYGAGDYVYAIAYNPVDGCIYVGGKFVTVGNAGAGDLTVNGIAKWNGSTWSALSTGVSGGGAAVWSIAIGPDGSVYISGDFSLAGGVANTLNIAKWNGAAWSALGTGVNAITNENCLVFGKDGKLYAGGNFTLAGGVANTVYIAYWGTDLAWHPLGTGMSASVTCLALGLDGSVYAGGDFITANGVTVNRITKWNGTTFVSLAGGANNDPYALAIGADGRLYAGGDFTTIGGVSCTRMAVWNGTAWIPLGSGVNDTVRSMCIAPDGSLYVGGLFTVAGGITLPDSGARWTGTTWLPLDVDEPGTPTWNYATTVDLRGNLYLGYKNAGSAYSATVTVQNVGSGTAIVKVVYTGPGTVWQLINYTTGKAIYFGGLTLLAGETAVLNLDPKNPTFISSFRGSLMNYILPGSNLNFELLPGNNNISTYLYGGTTAASGVVMTWKDQYWGVDAAAR